MQAKLTLSIDDNLARRAERYARERGKSLSQVIEQYLSYVTRDDFPPIEVTQEIAELSDTLPPSLFEGDWKLDYLTDKYLRD